MTGLRRSRKDRWIAGVAGGMAESLNVDPLLVRIGWIAAGIAVFPAALICYVVLWAALPEEAQSSAIQIAEERYARGEIGAEELARIRQDLGS